MTVTVTEHVVDVFGDDEGEYRAECWCGWTSELFGDEAVAADAGVDHRQVSVASRPENTFDAFMTSLLDMQDDIVRVVAWMAEHWASWLPAPSWHATSDLDGNGALRVLAYCPPAQFGYAADLLGADVDEDPQPDSCGRRYRRARRSFGRVVIEAITSADRR